MRELTVWIDDGAGELLEQCGIHFGLTDSFMVGRLIENHLGTPDYARIALGLDSNKKYWVCAHGRRTLPRDIFFTDDRDLAYDMCKRDREEELHKYAFNHKLPLNPVCWTEEQIRNWNDFIFYEGADVWAYDYENSTYLADYELTARDKKDIGWLEYKELCDYIRTEIM